MTNANFEPVPLVEEEVVILHTNDLHSHLANASKQIKYIRSVRQQLTSDRLLVFDIGDHLDRANAVTEGTDGAVNIDLLNAAGYDAVTLGNNEFLSFTMEQLNDRYGDEATCSVVCANMERTLEGEGHQPPWLHKSLLIRRGNIKFGIVGATAAFPDFYSLLQWESSDPIEAIRTQVKQLRDRVDVIIVLSHLGLPLDRELASQVEGIELILGGHTHHALEQPERVGTTLVCGAGKFGEYIGRIHVVRTSKEARCSFEARLVPMSDVAPLQAAIELIDEHRGESERKLGASLAVLEQPLDHALERQLPLASLLVEGLRQWCEGADVALVNTGQLLGGLDRGEVTLGLIHRLCPSPINPCLMKIKGREIREALDQSVLDTYQQMSFRGFGFRGERLGTLAVAGLTVFYELQQGQRTIVAVIVQRTGMPLQDEEQYIVASIDMFTFGVGYPSLQEGVVEKFYVPETLRDILAISLRSGQAIEAAIAAQPWQLINQNEGEHHGFY